MSDFISKLPAGDALAFSAIVTVCVTLGVIVWMLCWSRIRLRELELKRVLVDRGMSTEEVERVISVAQERHQDVVERLREELCNKEEERTDNLFDLTELAHRIEAQCEWIQERLSSPGEQTRAGYRSIIPEITSAFHGVAVRRY